MGVLLAIQAAPPTLAPQRGDPEHVEPTFYLGGQPYVVDLSELEKAGPELAEMALFETYRQMWSTWAEYHAGHLSRCEWMQRQTELLAGALALRSLIPGKEPLLPNGGFVTVH